MKKIVMALLVALLFIGCGSEPAKATETKLVIGKNLSDLKLKDQNGKLHKIDMQTKKLVFAFSKDIGHNCNEFFALKGKDYLKNNKVQFIADLSSAPSIIRSMFILPGLKDFKHDVLIIDDNKMSANYKPTTNDDKIVVVNLNKQQILDIKYLNTTKELEKYINKQ